MSTLRMFLCTVPLLGAAGAAAFALGRANARARASAPSDFEVFPRSTRVTEHARWYPTVEVLDRKGQHGAQSITTLGYSWTLESQPWECLELATSTPKHNHPEAMLLPDWHVLLPCPVLGPSADQFSQSPSADR